MRKTWGAIFSLLSLSPKTKKSSIRNAITLGEHQGDLKKKGSSGRQTTTKLLKFEKAI